MAAATIVHDTSEAVELCAAYGLYLKPITKMTISVALPQLKQPGKSISNWEVMERLKGMVPSHQFSALRIAKSTMEFIRFEGEVENRALVQAFLACLDGKSIKLSGFSDILRVRAAAFKADFPSRHDWDSFFRDAEDMDEALPGERPDTVHLEGLPCKWFAPRGSGSEKPSEAVLVAVFERFGAVRSVDIPMLDPYREEMAGRSFHTFSFGGHLNFEAYVQYREYAGFVRAMSALRGMKLMHKGEDGKAVACNIKVSFDSTKHLSDASIKKRQLERQKLQELERQREEQKRREKEAEEARRQEERKHRELVEMQRERKREEKLRRRQQKQRDRELRRSQRKLEKLQAEEQKRLQEKIRLEERKLLLAQRNLQSIRLVAELLSRAKAARLQAQQRQEERARQQRQDERRRLQEAELRRVEEEKARALGLQRKERQLRQRLLSILLGKRPADGAPAARARPDLLRPVLDILHSVSAALQPRPGARDATPAAGDPAPPACPVPDSGVNGPAAAAALAPQEAADRAARAGERRGGPGSPERERGFPGGVLACISDNAPPPPPPPPPPPEIPAAPKAEDRAGAAEQDKCNREPGRGGAGDSDPDVRHARSRSRRPGSRGDDEDGDTGDGTPPRRRRERRAHRKRAHRDAGSPPRRRADSSPRRSPSPDARARRERSRERRASAGRKHSRHRRRGDRSRSRSRSRSPRSPGRHRSAWSR
ncbi:A-kinase anchor protein 17A [Ctenodactylus gundi]